MSQNNSPKKVLEPTLFKLISCQHWRRLKLYLIMHKDIISTHHFWSDTYGSRFNALQYACNFHPPLDIIKCLCNADPKAIFNRDCRGRLALHIACTNGCSPSVVKYLLEIYPEAAEKTDIKDRTPFLLACKSHLWKSKHKWVVANKELLEILHTFVQLQQYHLLRKTTARMSMIRKDCYGNSPLDYLIEKEADIQVIRYVELVSSNIRPELSQKENMLKVHGTKQSFRDQYINKKLMLPSRSIEQTEKKDPNSQARAA